jgi:hypothetical protein
MVESRPTPVARSYTPHSDDDPALGAAIADVAARLRRSCAHLPPDDFGALVRQIARTALRWRRAEEQAARELADRRPCAGTLEPSGPALTA